MERTFTRRLLVSSVIAAGAAGMVSGCSGTPESPPEKNPVTTPEGAPPPISGGRAAAGVPRENTPSPPREVPPPPISGGTLHITQSGLAVAADSDRDLVWLVDLNTKAVSKVALKKGDEPGRVVEDAAGRIHV